MFLDRFYYQFGSPGKLISIKFSHTSSCVGSLVLVYEPPHGKTNNSISEQVRRKPACTVTEAG